RARDRTPDSALRPLSCSTLRRRGSRRRICRRFQTSSPRAPRRQAPTASPGWSRRRPGSSGSRGSSGRSPSGADRGGSRPLQRSGAAGRRTGAPGAGSLDLDRRDLGHGIAVVAVPPELERAALGRDGGEGDQRIRGDRGMQVDAAHLDTVVGAGEGADDVARDDLAVLRAPEAGLHRVLSERLDLDDLAALRARRHGDYGARHQISPSSRQAESVTTTSAASDQKEPSLIWAIAVTVWVSARRTRVAKLARPARGPRAMPTTSGSGSFSVSTWIAFTWSASVIGLSTATESGTELPLSMSGGSVSFTRPCVTFASPTICLRAAWNAALRFATRLGSTCAFAVAGSAADAAATIRNSRRVVISVLGDRQPRRRFVPR